RHRDGDAHRGIARAEHAPAHQHGDPRPGAYVLAVRQVSERGMAAHPACGEDRRGRQPYLRRSIGEVLRAVLRPRLQVHEESVLLERDLQYAEAPDRNGDPLTSPKGTDLDASEPKPM